jgi:hypothetical protein
MSSSLYRTIGKLVADNRVTILGALSKTSSAFYVYVLCEPPLSDEIRPFYVGIGQLDRVFSHEFEAKRPGSTGAKVEKIRKIWDAGGEVIRIIDGFFPWEPWEREEELINLYGLTKDGTGILANEQRYSPSHVRDGVELRKYVDEGNELPRNFIRRDVRLQIGPRSPSSPTSVYGKIYSVLTMNPGATGAELVELLLNVDFSANKSAYTKSGAVSRPWLAKYIDGGFYEKNRCIQEFRSGAA